jgi:hypothetical protein
MPDFRTFWDGSLRPVWDPTGVRVVTAPFTPRRVSSSERDRRLRSSAEHALSVEGLVFPVTTGGRRAAPVSVSGFHTDHYRYDKGHLMALELGGPDVRENIVPQWRAMNQNEKWRRMEQEIQEMALAALGAKHALAPSAWQRSPVPSSALRMRVDVQYGRDPSIPHLFHVVVREVSPSVRGGGAGTIRYQARIENVYSSSDLF